MRGISRFPGCGVSFSCRARNPNDAVNFPWELEELHMSLGKSLWKAITRGVFPLGSQRSHRVLDGNPTPFVVYPISTEGLCAVFFFLLFATSSDGALCDDFDSLQLESEHIFLSCHFFIWGSTMLPHLRAK